MKLDDWISLVISFLALLVSYLSHKATRRWYALDRRKFEEERDRRRFDISLIEAFKHDGGPSERLRWWGARLRVVNRTAAPIYINRLSFSLVFHKEYSPLSVRLLMFFKRYVKPDMRLSQSYGGSTVSSISGPLSFDLWNIGPVFLANWETKEPIRFSHRHPHRGPEPGEKEMWILFGKMPDNAAHRLQKRELLLSKIDCTIYTDEGTIGIVGDYSIRHKLSRHLSTKLECLAQVFTDDEEDTAQGA